MNSPARKPAMPAGNPKVVLLALVPLGAAFTFGLVRMVDNTVLQAILTCVAVGLIILAIALIVRSQLGAQTQEPLPMPDADRAVLDSLEPLHEDDRDKRS